MTQPQPDLFGKPRIQIKGNPLLEGIANHILDLKERDSTLLDGDTVGEIDRKLALAIWFEEGLKEFIPEGKRGAFTEWFKNPKHRPDEETISRARRYLLERGAIRIDARAVVEAERHRQRIARSVKG